MNRNHTSFDILSSLILFIPRLCTSIYGRYTFSLSQASVTNLRLSVAAKLHLKLRRKTTINYATGGVIVNHIHLVQYTFKQWQHNNHYFYRNIINAYPQINFGTAWSNEEYFISNRVPKNWKCLFIVNNWKNPQQHLFQDHLLKLPCPSIRGNKPILNNWRYHNSKAGKENKRGFLWFTTVHVFRHFHPCSVYFYIFHRLVL